MKVTIGLLFVLIGLFILAGASGTADIAALQAASRDTLKVAHEESFLSFFLTMMLGLVVFLLGIYFLLNPSTQGEWYRHFQRR